VYEQKREYAQNQVVKVNDIFDLVKQVKTSSPTEVEGEPISEEELLEVQLNRIKDEISDGTSNDLSDQTLITLLESTSTQLKIAREATTNAVYEIMSEQIQLRNLTQAKEEVRNKIVIS